MLLLKSVIYNVVFTDSYWAAELIESHLWKIAYAEEHRADVLTNIHTLPSIISENTRQGTQQTVMKQ